MNHIFVSHSHEDVDFAENLHGKLTQAGLDVWRDTGIRVAEDWRREIDEAIKEAFALVVIMTPEAKTSEYVTYEWGFAWGAGIKVVPVLLKNTELHPRLESLQYLDFTNRNVRPWDTLIKLLHQVKSSRPQQEQAVYQVHEYSGTWEADNIFSRWRGYDLGVNDTVTWHGKMLLLLSADGKKGTGAGIGKLYVSIGNYKATYENGAWINRAHITEDGTLHLELEVLYRVLIEEKGEPSEARFREGLFGAGTYSVDLKPVLGTPKKLQGEHTYDPGDRIYQEAKEKWTYLGF